MHKLAGSLEQFTSKCMGIRHDQLFRELTLRTNSENKATGFRALRFRVDTAVLRCVLHNLFKGCLQGFFRFCMGHGVDGTDKLFRCTSKCMGYKMLNVPPANPASQL